MKHIDCRNHSLTDGSSYRSTLPVGSIRILHEVIARKPNQRFVSALCPCVHVCLFRNRQHFFCFLATVTIEKDLFHHIQFLDNIHHFLGRGCTWRIIQIEIYFSTPCFQKLFQCGHLLIGHPSIPVQQIILLNFSISHFRNISCAVSRSIDCLVMTHHDYSIACEMSVTFNHIRSCIDGSFYSRYRIFGNSLVCCMRAMRHSPYHFVICIPELLHGFCQRQ